MKRIVNYTIIAGILISSIAEQTLSQSQDLHKSYDPVKIQRIADLQQELIDSWFWGSSHAVIYKDGELIYDGIINSGKNGDQDITDQTIFPIWSMSKPITTVAVMILFEEEKLKLDDPIELYIPELGSLQCLDKDGNEYPCKNKVTIRHLLTHEAGFSNYPDARVNNKGLIYDKPFTDLEDFTKQIAHIPLASEPGTKYNYGLNTAILGRLIEVVSGQKFYTFLKEKIFDPLDMPDTDFDITDDERGRFQPLFVREKPTGYFTSDDDGLSWQPGTKIQLGGEGLVSTTADYSHFCEMLLNDGVYKGNRIISPASIALMHKPVTESLLKGGFKSGFTFFHLTDSVKDGSLSPEGIFGWGGLEGTFFWIDQKNNLYGLVMTRKRGSSAIAPWPKFRLATYQALEELP